MPLDALLMVLVAAVLHASWNFWVKKAQIHPLAFSLLCSVVSTLAYAPFVWWFFKDSGLGISSQGWWWIAASCVVHNLYFFVLQTGYARSDLSIVYPLARGTGPLLSATGAIFLLGEIPTIYSILGLLLVVLGTFTIAGGVALLDRSKVTSPKIKAGLIWGMMTGACIATYTLLDGYAVKYLLIAPLVFDWICAPIRGVMLLPIVLQQRVDLKLAWRQAWPYVMGVGVVSPFSYILVLTAMQKAPISHVAPAREVSMLVAAFLGAKLLNEGELKRRLMGAALIALGVAALATGR
jgi:drug/metabolite transporter (DMT)-like permease